MVHREGFVDSQQLPMEEKLVNFTNVERREEEDEELAEKVWKKQKSSWWVFKVFDDHQSKYEYEL